MKKLLSILLIVVFTAAMLVGCSSTTTTAPTPTPTPIPAPAPAPADGTGIAKIGLGHITSIASSKDLGVDKDGKEVLPLGQVDTVMVAAAFDKDGKVVSVTIDNAQTKVNFSKDGKVTSDKTAEQKTKVELKEGYGMIKASTIGKEWYQQADELGKWMIGKTVDEIKAMKVKAKDAAHPAVPDVPELTSLVTMTVNEFIEALGEASANTIDANGAVKLGLGHNISIAKSTDLGVDKDGKEVLPMAEVDTIIAATAFDKDGKVVNTIIDSAQTKVNFSKEVKVTSDKTAEIKTKNELKEGYGMIKASTIGKEWYQQAAELGKWMIGKTVDEIKAMKVKAKDAAHQAVPDLPELTSLVTMSVNDYIQAVAEAYTNAK